MKNLTLSIFLLCITLSVISQNTYNQNNYDVVFYGIDIQVSDTSSYLKGNTTIDILVLEKSDTVILNLGNQLEVSSVELNDSLADFIHLDEKLIIIDSFQEDKKYRMKVFYQGDGNDKNHDGAVFTRQLNNSKFTYTLTEPYSAKYWYPCKEVLSDKADSVYVFITTEKKLKAGSNGLLFDVVEIDQKHVQYQWKSFYPVAFYLISFAVGDFMDYTFYVDLGDSIPQMPVVNYIFNSESDFKNNKQKIDKTGDLIKLFSDLFGIYPFYKEKYGHCQTPMGGGMEHQTMTTLNNFDFDLVAHELAHQWFGNYVTCKYWNDIWINEGFASYSEYIALENLFSKEVADEWMNHAQSYVMTLRDGSIYVPDNELYDAHRVFDYILSYKKGASIIHMIRYELGNDDLFFRVIKEFLSKHAFGAASGEDFKQVLEERSGKSFDNFFNEWYYGQGYPILNVDWYQKNDTLYLFANQTVSAPERVGLFHLKIQFKALYPTGDSLFYLEMNEKQEVYKIFLNKPVYDVVVDPQNYLLMKQIINHLTDSGDMSLSPVLFFPNPAKHELSYYSRVLYEPFNIDIYNISGRKVKTFTGLNPFGDKLSLAGLEAGVYFFYLNADDFSSAIKIIKQ
ncbi:MAG: T9SS type A sorting domain-containing protein [Bacteroidales bacterium]|nr:T9SS type A sorting domain-containing protein [Bacteroidales bacterium]